MVRLKKSLHVAVQRPWFNLAKIKVKPAHLDDDTERCIRDTVN